MGTYPFGQQCGLIETALALPRGMEWNGNDRVETPFAKTFVVEGGDQPPRDQVAKMNLPAVFKVEHDMANNPTAAKSRNRGVEIEGAMRAIGAGERGCDCAIKRLRTFVAKWRYDSGNFRFTLGAEIFAKIDRRRADGAGRRVKQRRDSAKKVRDGEHRHISTSRALSTTSSRRRRAGQFQREEFFQATARRATGGAQPF